MQPVRHPWVYLHSFAAIGLAGLASACGRDEPKANLTTGPASTGSLAVTIATPAGITGSVAITGPSGFHQMLSASGTFARVPTGVFTVAADSVVTPDSVVGSRTDTGMATEPSVTVTANDTGRTSVAYALKQRRGVMWVSNDDGAALYAFGADSLTGLGGSTPLDTLSGGLYGPTQEAFDPSGNLWVANEATASIVMFSAAQLAAGGKVLPVRTLSDNAVSDGLGLRFDPHGNMWVTSDSALYEFTPDQLAAGGTQAATVAISGPLLKAPIDMVFDSAGNMWVSDGLANAIMKFTAAQLTATDTAAVPVDTIGTVSGSLFEPTGLAVDRNGNLWVANYLNATIVAYSPSQLAAGGSATPLVTVAPVGAATPWGLAFDARGTLWVADFNAHTVTALTASQLAAGGTQTPTLTITSVAGPSYPIFDPVTPMVPGAGHAARVRGSGSAHTMRPAAATAPGRPGRRSAH